MTAIVVLVSNLCFLPSTNGNSSSWSSLGLEGEAYEEHISFSPSDRLVRLFVLESFHFLSSKIINNSSIELNECTFLLPVHGFSQ